MEYSVEDFKKYILGEPGACYYPHGSVYRCLPEAVGYSFCEANDFEYFKIGMKYMDALKYFVDACGKNEELEAYLSAQTNELFAQKIDTAPVIDTYRILKSIKNEDSMYEYQNLYFTPNLRRACITYAKRAYKFGEIGNVAFSLMRFAKQGNIHVEMDSDTENLLTEWYVNTNERKPDPIIIKLKPEAYNRIDANEKGEIFDAKSILAFKYTYLDIAISKFVPNDIEHAMYIQGLKDGFLGFRTDKNLTDNDFTILEWEETDQEIEQTIENKERLKKEYYEYVEHFCVEHEKSLNDEEYVKGLKEHFGLLTFEEEMSRIQRKGNSNK